MRSISSPPLAAFRSRRLSRRTSNKGLNSNESLEESTATSSSVMLSGIRREKVAPGFLDIEEHTTNSQNSDPRAKSGQRRRHPPSLKLLRGREIGSGRYDQFVVSKNVVDFHCGRRFSPCPQNVIRWRARCAGQRAAPRAR